jgi:PPOX class probable F420-dependent enzyme
MADLNQFKQQQYLNIETFRKNGAGVKTPVWFAQDGDSLFIWTESSSGKAKRIRNNGQVNIAPSKNDGTVTGEWAAAQASVDGSDGAKNHTKALMERKYGLAYKMFDLLGRLRKSTPVSIKVDLA